MAKVELHSVLGHTAKRILQIQKEIINYIEADSVNNVILIVALALLNTSRGFQIQIFVTWYVPLRLITKSKTRQIIWKKHRPSSTRYCRPIRFQFKKENT